MSPCNHSLEVTGSVAIAWILSHFLNQLCEMVRREISYFHEFTYSVICNPGSDAGLIEPYRDRHYGNPLCQCF